MPTNLSGKIQAAYFIVSPIIDITYKRTSPPTISSLNSNPPPTKRKKKREPPNSISTIRVMAEECTDSSVATSSSAPNWWDLHGSSTLSSCYNSTNPWSQPNPNSNSSCEEEVSISTSFTNASNHSGLTVESSRRLIEPASSTNELIGEPAASDSHLWSHVLL